MHCVHSLWSDSIFLFSFQRSSARTNGIQRSVHRCGALSIELLQRQITLMLHYSSLLEVCDLYCNQHSSTHTKRSFTPGICVLTQLLAHALSNSLSSGAQTSLAFLSSRTLSTMLWRSRHLKKLSRPSQHTARALRSGAMKPPSWEGAGGGGAGGEEEPPNQPIVNVCCVVRG
jgi:hypothetical protein